MKTVTTGLRIGAAIDAAISGKMIQRAGWNGKGMFVFAQVPSEIGMDIIPKMQSLPAEVKMELQMRGRSIKYSNQLALVKSDNSISGWSPSTEDAMASDWNILEAGNAEEGQPHSPGTL